AVNRQLPTVNPKSLQNLRHHTGTHGASALADRKTQAFLHRNRRNQLHRHLDVVTRHHHLNARRQLHRTRHVRRTEVKLRTIPLEERRVATALLDRKSTRLNSSHVKISYAVFCLKKKKT